MEQGFTKIPDDLFGPYRQNSVPNPARRRFQPTPETDDFLNQCNELGLDLSTIINLGLNSIRPVTRPCGATWEGIKNLS